jgi:hypothetical protein
MKKFLVLCVATCVLVSAASAVASPINVVIGSDFITAANRDFGLRDSIDPESCSFKEANSEMFCTIISTSGGYAGTVGLGRLSTCLYGVVIVSPNGKHVSHEFSLCTAPDSFS